MSNSPLILAVDSPDLSRCRDLIQATREYVGVYKFGLEFFTANGRQALDGILREYPEIRIFLDLKLHDIPNTVGKASSNFVDMRIEFLTVHAAGGPEMIRAAVSALPNTRITAVTVLTSLDSQILTSMGMNSSISEIVERWAELAVTSGARAIVASPLEVSLLRRILPREVALITPGIRPALAKDDQKRTMTPKQALEAGADYLVIGRPITDAPDVRTAAREIFDSLQ